VSEGVGVEGFGVEGFGVGLFVAVGVIGVGLGGIGVIVFVDVGRRVGVLLGGSSLSLVGGKSQEKNASEVGVGVSEAPEIGINARLKVGVGTSVNTCVAGRTMLVGTNSAIMLTASAAAVLFMLAKDTSFVLRDWRSIEVGGFGLNPAITKTIQPIPKQRPKDPSACKGIKYCRDFTPAISSGSLSGF